MENERFSFEIKNNSYWLDPWNERVIISVFAKLHEYSNSKTEVGILWFDVDYVRKILRLRSEVENFQKFDLPETDKEDARYYSIYDFDPSKSFDEARDFFINAMETKGWNYEDAYHSRL